VFDDLMMFVALPRLAEIEVSAPAGIDAATVDQLNWGAVFIHSRPRASKSKSARATARTPGILAQGIALSIQV
jgi:hypothetical protein